MKSREKKHGLTVGHYSDSFRFTPERVKEVEKQRTIQMSNYVPGIWQARSVLYIGANIERFHYGYAFKTLADQMIGHRIKQFFDVIEINRARAKELKEAHQWIDRVIVGDIRDIDDLPVRDHYAATVWSHGPTILPYEDIEPTLDKLEALTMFLVVSCPWGKYKHRKEDETHELDTNISELRPMFFVEKGYAVHCVGKPNRNGSNILAWKIVSEHLLSRGIGL
ncbi:MAG: hypothetical protein ACYSW3_00285 [Planctomycetota bacterium]|jgi:hypothetical protein